jgi:hypothetical protein
VLDRVTLAEMVGPPPRPAKASDRPRRTKS